MRVALIIDCFEPVRGGAETYLDQLACNLRERGHEVHILCWRAAHDRGDVVLIAAPSQPRLLREIVFAVRSARCARSYDVSLAVRHALEADVYQPHGGVYTTAERATLECGGAVRRTMGCLLHAISLKHRWFRALERRILRRAHTIVALSRTVRDDLRTKAPGAARIELLYNGVDLHRFTPAADAGEADRVRSSLGVHADARVLLHVGHNYRLKGLSYAVRALANASLPNDLWLVHVGRHQPHDVLRLARRLGVRDRLVIAGARDDMNALYRTAAMLVHPTHYDPCSLVTLEALACGTPVITSARNGASELMSGSEAGVILPHADDVSGIVTAIGVLLGRGSSARLAARAVAECHPWGSHFARMETLLRAAARTCRESGR